MVPTLRVTAIKLRIFPFALSEVSTVRGALRCQETVMNGAV